MQRYTESPMRIHHVLPAFGRIARDPINDAQSGVVQSPLAFARRFAAQGHAVRLGGWSEGEPRVHRSPEGVEISTHPGYRLGRLGRWDVRWLAPMMLHSLFAPEPDILHVHVDPNLMWLRGRAKILHLHAPAVDVSAPAYARLLGRADAVVACSEYVRRQFLKTSGWDARRTFHVPNGTDLDRFQPASLAEKTRSRTNLNLDHSSFVVMYVGAIVEEKGPLHLVKAFDRLSLQFPGARLVVAGSGRLWGNMDSSRKGLNSYEALVRQDATERVLLLGDVPHAAMPGVMRAADVVVVPSVCEESFSMAALDGLATGLPVVASRVGGLPELVEDGRNGILVPPGDEGGLSAAILRLAGDPELRRRMGLEARRRSLRYSWDQVSSELGNVYELALDHAEANRTSKRKH